MKKHLILILLIVLVSAFSVFSQDKKNKPDKKDGYPVKVYKANPEDVKSIDSILKATYDVISGGVGVKRNWDRFRSLFHPSARLTPTGRNPQTGATIKIAAKKVVKFKPGKELTDSLNTRGW